MSDTPKHSVSVAGIVVNDKDEVLVIKRRDNGHWEPPGGILELNETFEQGVVREIKEETGMKVTVDHLTGVYRNMERGIVALVFRCTPAGTPENLSDEGAEITWMTKAEICERMTPAFSIRVMDAFNSMASVRVHNGTFLNS